MSWVATASSNTVESRYRFRRPRKIPVCAITSATSAVCLACGQEYEYQRLPNG